jgi:hypothetical protein
VQIQRGEESSKAKGRCSWEKMWKHNHYTWGEPLLKEDSLARAPRRHRKARPTRTGATQPMTRGLGPTSHSAGVRVSWCEEDKPSRKERTAARGSAPLHLCQNQQPSLWHGGPGPQSHTAGVRVSECKEGELSREEQTTAPLHLR